MIISPNTLVNILLATMLLYLSIYLYTMVVYRATLTRVRRRSQKLVDYLKTHDPVNFALLIKKFRPENIRFSLFALDPQDRNYTLDKTVIYVCPDNDMDAMMFVVIHELAHIANKEYGHHAMFWDTFRDLLDYSEEIGIYKPLSFPHRFCGFKITRDFEPPED